MENTQEETVVENNVTPSNVDDQRIKLTNRMIALSRKHDELKDQAAKIWHEYEALDAQLVQLMQNEELQNFKDSQGRTIFLKSQASVKVHNEVALKNWLKNNQMGDLIKETINSASLKATLKECYENGTVEFPGADLTFRTIIGIRGLNKGEVDPV